MDDEKRKNDDGQFYELATSTTRFFALVVDNVALSYVASLGLSRASTGNSAAFVILINFLYHWIFWTQRDGQTPGKMLLKIKVIRSDGQPLTANDCVLRYVGYWLSAIPLGLGFIWASFDRRNQAWHDKLAKTYVVRSVSSEQGKKHITI